MMTLVNQWFPGSVVLSHSKVAAPCREHLGAVQREIIQSSQSLSSPGFPKFV